MQNLDAGLKRAIYGLMDKDDVKDIVLILRDRFELTDNIDDVSFSYEESQNLFYENAVDFDIFDKSLVINVPILHTKFAKLTDIEAYPYNWMVLFYELIYALEDIRINKELDEREKNNVTNVVRTYKDFIKGNGFVRSHPSLKKIMPKKVTKADNLIDPIERIKSIHAYYYTINIFNSLHINPTSINNFKNEYGSKLLNGYKYNDPNSYPLKSMFFQNSYLEGIEYMMRFNWFSLKDMKALSNASSEVNSLQERLALGYPIDSVEYILVKKNKI